MATVPPPPTYADVVLTDERTKKSVFNPIWLNWFLEIAQTLSQSGGGGGGGIQHNSLAGLQGGSSAERYHLTAAEANEVAALPATFVDSFNTRTGAVSLTSADVVAVLPATGVTPGSYTNTNITVDATGRLSAAANGGSSGGVASFNTRTGAVTLDSADVTGALGYTPLTNEEPVFSVYLSGNVGITASTPTKVPFANATFDSASYFDLTNNRYTPKKAGFFQIDATAQLSVTTGTVFFFSLYKNGSEYLRGSQLNLSSGNFNAASQSLSAIIDFNGSTDYVELWVYCVGTSPEIIGGSTITSMSGALIRKP